MPYECQNFVDGQVLDAECLNRMERGIEDAHKSLPPDCDTTDCSKVLSFGPNGLEWITKPSDGKTPYIGTNGNWWIGDTDTGVSAGGSGGSGGSSSVYILAEGEDISNVPADAVLVIDPCDALTDAEGVGF